jgi:hypothetical protein
MVLTPELQRIQMMLEALLKRMDRLLFRPPLRCNSKVHFSSFASFGTSDLSLLKLVPFFKNSHASVHHLRVIQDTPVMDNFF